MTVWIRSRYREALEKAPPSLSIEPLLSPDQIGEISIDLRLGYDFLVSVLNRDPVIQITAKSSDELFTPKSHFQETRREIGDSFVLYPNQLVLATTLEYVGVPDNAYADISPRSSYSRLGLAVGGMLQPGFRGCVPLELLNHGNVPVELSVGARICQIRIFDVGADSNYHGESGLRKYYGQVRPSVSKASRDSELQHLSKLPRVIRAAKK